jgi:hypothetical protein
MGWSHKVGRVERRSLRGHTLTWTGQRPAPMGNYLRRTFRRRASSRSGSTCHHHRSCRPDKPDHKPRSSPGRYGCRRSDPRRTADPQDIHHPLPDGLPQFGSIKGVDYAS